ncbi:hypothetical protein QYF36_003530 [Acer negundo]|nr:hypothetical protein QYF36_003530 [Acer negundo]
MGKILQISRKQTGEDRLLQVFTTGDLPMIQVDFKECFCTINGWRWDRNKRIYGCKWQALFKFGIYAVEECIKTGEKAGKSSLEQISKVYENQAVVVSIDPHRVYLKSSSDVEFMAIRV